MRTGTKGIELIKSFEGYRGEAYRDIVGVCTIGYGTTQYPDNTPVHDGDVCTPEQAEGWLRNDLLMAERGVRACIDAEINQNQFDALVSFCYNLGVSRLHGSTLRNMINSNPNDSRIPDEFMKWNRAGGKVVAGLTRRRKAEADLYGLMP